MAGGITKNSGADYGTTFTLAYYRAPKWHQLYILQFVSNSRQKEKP